jgi:hypothetical protein
LFCKAYGTNLREGWTTSEEAVRTMGSLKLCRADMTRGGLPLGVMSKPMRGGTVEARTRGPWGQTSERKRQERIDLRSTG